ncbi:Hypothetical predicted protein, partial [Pelobates cultripes]
SDVHRRGLCLHGLHGDWEQYASTTPRRTVVGTVGRARKCVRAQIRKPQWSRWMAGERHL